MGNQIIFAMEVILVCACGIFHIYKVSFTINSIIIFLLFLFNTIISIFCDIFNNYISINDLYEIANPFAFLLFYTFYRQSNLQIQILEKITLYTIVMLFLLLSIYSIFEFFFPTIIRPISIFLYQIHEQSIDKAAGSIGISYQFGYILLLPLIYSLIFFLKHFSIKYFILFSLQFFTLLLTQSRAIYITCACIFVIVFCLPYFYSNVKSSLRIILFIFILISFLINIYITYQEELKDIFTYAIYGFKNIARNTDISMNTREDQFYWAIENNKLVLFGGGLSKNIMMLESFYSLYYYRYGLLSTIVYLLMLIITAHTAYKITKHEVNSQISIFYLSLFVFFLISPIGLLNSCNQNIPKTSFLFYGLIGLIFNKYQTIKSK
jgi:hypothetical protein